MTLNNQDRNTILAALRFYQENGQGDPDNRSDEIHGIATGGGEDVSMDGAGIDDLCERLNVDSPIASPDQLDQLDLLDALEAVTRCLAWHERYHGVGMDRAALGSARDAIAKAKGL